MGVSTDQCHLAFQVLADVVSLACWRGLCFGSGGGSLEVFGALAVVYQRRSMEARLWQKLPFEPVERGLLFLSAPDLCRCRGYYLACKRNCELRYHKVDSMFVTLMLLIVTKCSSGCSPVSASEFVFRQNIYS